MSLTNNVLTEVDRVRTRYALYNAIRLLYVLAMVGICAYAKYTGWYGFWYGQIVSFVLTANIIWLYFDIFQSPLDKIVQLIKSKRFPPS